MAQNKDLVADAQTLLEENLSEKKSVESARRLGSKGQLPTSVLTLVPVRSNSLFDWLFDNKRLANYSKELLLGFGEKLVNFGSLSRENRTKD